MANDVAQNLRAFMLNDNTLRGLVTDVHENQVPQSGTMQDYVWFQQVGKVYEQATDDAAGVAPRSVLFDCECCSRRLDNSIKIADAVRNLFPYRGSFGDATVKGVFVNDQSEDYAPLNDMGDIGMNVQSLQIEVCP